jgi:dTDP-glucose 4,6-dehydratase
VVRSARRDNTGATMKLLVTGGAGFIGSNFIRYWLEAHPEDEVINLDLLTYAGNLANLADVERECADRYRFVQGDIGNFDLVFHLLQSQRPSAIVNFAAESHNSRAIEKPGLFFQTNVVGTQTLLEAAARAGVPRFHHISTCEVFGDLELDSEERFSETSPLRPRTPYNASKAGADLAVRAYAETFKLPVTVSVCCNNYGPYQMPEKVIPHFTVRAMTNQPLTLYRSSNHRREWLHVNDHCRALDLILTKGRIGETYNIGSGVEADIETIADIVISQMGLDDSSKSYVPDRPGHDRRYLLDSSKIERELGWQPRIAFDEGIRATIDWYRQHESWWQPLLARLEVNETGWVMR